TITPVCRGKLMSAVTLGALIISLLAVAGAMAAWGILRRRRRSRSRKHASADALLDLAKALREVQLFGPDNSTLDLQANEGTAEVVDATNDLLGRLDRYRERLLARDQRLRRLLGNITDILYQAGPDLRLTWVTDSVQHVLG